MNVVLYGATGNSGSRILKELVSRGHSVTAIARDTSKIPTEVIAKQDDLSDVDSIVSLIRQIGPLMRSRLWSPISMMSASRLSVLRVSAFDLSMCLVLLLPEGDPSPIHPHEARTF